MVTLNKQVWICRGSFFPALYAKAPDIGGAENDMAYNLDLLILVISFYEASDHRIGREAITEVAEQFFRKYRFLRKIINVNHPRHSNACLYH